MRRAAAAFAIATGMAAGGLFAALPAIADVTAQDVEEARAELREVNDRLADEVARYDAALIEELELRGRLDQLVTDLGARERELAIARRTARDRVADMYMAARSSRASEILAVSRFGEVPARMAYLDTVAETDHEVMVRLDAARAGYERQQALLEELLAEQEELRAEIEGILGGIYAELEDANAEYQAVKAEWDRQEAERRYREWLATSTTTTIAPPSTTAPSTTEAGDDANPTTTEPGGDGSESTTSTTQPAPPPPPPQPGVMACPVDGATTFRDSWGEPRPGGRTHTGTDMMATTGTPVVAIEDGSIWYKSWHYAGGNGLYIQGDSGDRWYYAHLDGYAAGISVGDRVSVGQLVGYVGSTGNASVPHLHFARIQGGETYVNPYPLLVQIC